MNTPPSSRFGIVPALLVVGLALSSAYAQTTTAVPGFFNFQGKVANANGTLVGAGTPVNRTVIFRIWDHTSNSTTGNLVYSEQQTVTITDGEFSVLIGQGVAVSGTPLGYSEAAKGPPTVKIGDPSVFGSATRYLGITIDDNNSSTTDPEITPRQQLVTSPFAFRARYAESVGSNGVNAINAVDNGNIGIGTTNPQGKLDVNGAILVNSGFTNTSARPAVGTGRLAGELGGYSSAGAYGDDGFLRLSAGGGTTASAKSFIDLSGFSNVPDMDANIIFGTAGAERLRITKTGLVGIGTSAPNATLDVAGALMLKGTLTNASGRPVVGTSRLAAEIAGYSSVGAYSDDGFLRLSAGGGTNASAKSFIDLSGYSGVSDMNANITLGTGGTERMRIMNDGKVGIGTTAPRGKVDVAGSVFASGGYGDSGLPGGPGISLGGGGTSPNAASVSWGDNSGWKLNFGTSANNVFTPRVTFMDNGYVGIGTTSPFRGRLEIADAGANLGLGPYYYVNGIQAAYYNSTTTAAVSIYANQRIVCNEFNALSDERIKNVKGRSDARADLATMMGVEIVDYVYRDVVGMGNVPHKKVIAQQVEKVFPQAVKRSTDTIPDIYKLAGFEGSWILLATDLKPGDRVKLISDTEAGVHEVLAVEPGRFRTSLQPKGEKVFVYGREVKDFRVVDYEAIAMLNVSATQEIKREKDAEIAGLKQRIAELEAKERARDAKLASIEKLLRANQTVMARPAAATNNSHGQE